jgi:hypothetical protein
MSPYINPSRNRIAPDYVTLECEELRLELTALLGPERPEVSAGYGGWDEVDRPRRTTVTTWRGLPARRISLDLLIDNLYEGTSIEPRIRKLERMASPTPDGGQPPEVRVRAVGGVVPTFYERRTWVIEGLAWGDAVMNRNGNRIRQAVTVTLLEYISDELIEVRKTSSKRRRERHKRKGGKDRKRGARRKRHAARRGRPKRRGRAASAQASSTLAFEGEDLKSLAARELGDAGRWREIAELNGIRDPRAIAIGQVLRLP